MNKDALRESLDSIEKWCNNNDIAVFYGTIDENVATEISWDKPLDGEWEKFLSVAKKADARIIVIDIFTNEIDSSSGEILIHKETLEEDNEEECLQDYVSSLKIIEESTGQVASFSIYFIIENVCYSYTQFASWYDDLLAVEEAFPENEDYNADENYKPTVESLSEEKIEELARKITESEKYLAAKADIQRNQIVDELLDQDEITEYSNRWPVQQKVGTIYYEEILPKQTEELRKKVLELKSKGLKKVEVVSKLNISAARVNKFWYTDNSE